MLIILMKPGNTWLLLRKHKKASRSFDLEALKLAGYK
jgi:hypothetical protein